MKVCIVGTGVIGSIYGQQMSRSGHQVVHLVRRLDDPRVRDGFEIRLLDGRMQPASENGSYYRPTAIDALDATQRFDLILASVRHDRLEALLPVLAAGRGSADVLLFGGRWEGLEPVDAVLGRGSYLWGYPVAGGGFRDDVLDAALLGDVHLGEPVVTDGRRLEGVSGLFRSVGLTVDVPSDILSWLVVHFAIEAGIIGAAIAAGDPDGFLDSTEWLTEGILAVRDALAVVQARGISVEAAPDAQVFFAPADMVAAGIREQYQVDLAARKIMTRHTGREELGRIFGDVLATARALGVSTPVLDRLEPAVDAYASVAAVS
ncbi:MAG TPA: 2-dehydropantoate 2-reductase N-terminal domain-containing protein [Candidatus Binatia bacterium]|nr:2-dehydropantoate 2-reductase N-terminal domain-containing protein [Candidatus Binatia bacterium]